MGKISNIWSPNKNCQLPNMLNESKCSQSYIKVIRQILPCCSGKLKSSLSSGQVVAHRFLLVVPCVLDAVSRPAGEVTSMRWLFPDWFHSSKSPASASNHWGFPIWWMRELENTTHRWKQGHVPFMLPTLIFYHLARWGFINLLSHYFSSLCSNVWLFTVAKYSLSLSLQPKCPQSLKGQPFEP